MKFSYDDLHFLWVTLERPMYSSGDAIGELEDKIKWHEELEDKIKWHDSSSLTFLSDTRKELREEKAIYNRTIRLRKRLLKEMHRLEKT